VKITEFPDGTKQIEGTPSELAEYESKKGYSSGTITITGSGTTISPIVQQPGSPTPWPNPTMPLSPNAGSSGVGVSNPPYGPKPYYPPYEGYGDDSGSIDVKKGAGVVGSGPNGAWWGIYPPPGTTNPK
jgi:hypothetical protein